MSVKVEKCGIKSKFTELSLLYNQTIDETIKSPIILAKNNPCLKRGTSHRSLGKFSFFQNNLISKPNSVAMCLVPPIPDRLLTVSKKIILNKHKNNRNQQMNNQQYRKIQMRSDYFDKLTFYQSLHMEEQAKITQYPLESQKERVSLEISHNLQNRYQKNINLSIESGVRITKSSTLKRKKFKKKAQKNNQTTVLFTKNPFPFEDD